MSGEIAPNGDGHRGVFSQSDQAQYPPHKLYKMSETIITTTTPDTRIPPSRKEEAEGGWPEPIDAQPLPPVDAGKYAYRFLGAAFVIEGLVWVRPYLPMPLKKLRSAPRRDSREAMAFYLSTISMDRWGRPRGLRR